MWTWVQAVSTQSCILTFRSGHLQALQYSNRTCLKNQPSGRRQLLLLIVFCSFLCCLYLAGWQCRKRVPILVGSSTLVPSPVVRAVTSSSGLMRGPVEQVLVVAGLTEVGSDRYWSTVRFSAHPLSLPTFWGFWSFVMPDLSLGLTGHTNTLICPSAKHLGTCNVTYPCSCSGLLSLCCCHGDFFKWKAGWNNPYWFYCFRLCSTRSWSWSWSWSWWVSQS